MSGEPPVHRPAVTRPLGARTGGQASRLKPGTGDGLARAALRSRGRGEYLHFPPDAAAQDLAICIPASTAWCRAEDIAVISAGRHRGLVPRPMTAADCGSPRQPDGGDGAAGSPATPETSWPDGPLPN